MMERNDGHEYDVLGDPVNTSKDGLIFYRGLTINSTEILIGSCVQLEIESDPPVEATNYNKKKSRKLSLIEEEEQDSIAYGYGQILAVYSNPSADDVFIEVRWFYSKDEIDLLTLGRKKQKQLEIWDDELVESDIVDDVSAGAIRESVQVIFGSHSSTVGVVSNRQITFRCRYFKAKESHAVQVIDGKKFVSRGLEYSYYAEYYSHLIIASGTDYSTLISNNTPLIDTYHKAIQNLHVSVLPEELPCRANEQEAIMNQLRSYITDPLATRAPLYICGMPGTGKTATVNASIAALHKESKRLTAGSSSTTKAGATAIGNTSFLPQFNFFDINCLRLTSPSEAFTVFWRCMSGQVLSSKRALERLQNYFITRESMVVSTSSTAPSSSGLIAGRHKGSSTSSGENGELVKSNTFTVLLLDEIDFLLTNDANVLYSFFNWPLMRQSQLAVIGVSNVMDLPERVANRVKSRMGSSIVRISFTAYTHVQLKTILMHRLNGLGLPIFESTAIEFLSRKAANIAGDLRAALKICQRTIQIYCERHKDYLSQARVGVTDATDLHLVSTIKSQAALSSPSTVNISSAAEIATGPRLITTEIVRLAVEEYSCDPFRSYLLHACQLEKVLVACICRHVKATGQNEISMDMLWDRLQDVIKAVSDQHLIASQSYQRRSNCSGDVSSSAVGTEIEVIRLLLPPYEIFESTVRNLVDVGIFKQNQSRLAWIVPRLMTVSLRPEMTIVTSAFNKTPYESFL